LLLPAIVTQGPCGHAACSLDVCLAQGHAAVAAAAMVMATAAATAGRRIRRLAEQ
tara:strand:- start:158 stop:322 length:165 start_codon:yes stop_codon:yes gene_type:complete